MLYKTDGRKNLFDSLHDKKLRGGRKIKPRCNYVFIGKIQFYISLIPLAGGGRFMVLLVTILDFQISQIHGALKSKLQHESFSLL